MFKNVGIFLNGQQKVTLFPFKLKKKERKEKVSIKAIPLELI